MFSIILRVLKLLKNEKKKVFLLFIANALFSFLVLCEPVFFKYVIDLLNNFSGQESQKEILFSTLILWAIFWCCTIAVRLFVSIYADRLAHTQYNVNVFRFFSHSLDLSLNFHQNMHSGQSVKKITKGVDGIFDMQLNFFRRMLPSIFTCVMLIPVVLYFEWKLGLFVIFLWFLSWSCTYFIASKTFSMQTSIEDIYSEMSGLYSDTFSNIPIIKSFTLERKKIQELKHLTDIRIKKQFPVLYWWWLIISFSQILRIIVTLGIIFFGSYLFISEQISLGKIVMFLSFSLILLSCIEEITWTLEGMFWRIAAIRDYFEVCDSSLDVRDMPGAWTLPPLEGNVKFKNVSFSYDGKRKVLKNINLSVKAWEKVAFVGHTGSWKTTMMSLLLRFFEWDQGEILLDGISHKSVTQDSLRKNIGVVFQDNSLFHTSILQNICLGSENIKEEDIGPILEKSGAKTFIHHLSEGVHTLVWERGVKLSGWERQRLAIARAFFKNAPILILDEATSALDAETEKFLQTSFDELMKGKTTFIIAHRLSTIRKADTIYVFDAGKIVEEWSYSELLKQEWYFARLVQAQNEGFIE